MAIPVNPEFIVQTLSDLVRINSVNPALADGPGEAEIAGYVRDRLHALGLETASHEPEPGRVSVVGRLGGDGAGRTLMFNAHHDTVGVEGMASPFTPEVRGGRLYGRGAYDMKGSLAACLGAAKALIDGRVPLRGEVLIAAVADEEHASLGTADLLGRYRVDGAVVTEPTHLEICVAHKGFVWMELETRGRAAHGSLFDEGIDAIAHMGRVLARIDALASQLEHGETRHALVGPPSLHAAIISGGSGMSTYADRCRLCLERRTIPGEGEETVVAEIETILRELAEADAEFDAVVRTLLARSPFEVDREAAVVQAVAEAATETLQHPPGYRGESAWMDSALLADAGIETVVLGPAGAGAHGLEEWVDVASVLRLAEVLAGAAARYSA